MSVSVLNANNQVLHAKELTQAVALVTAGALLGSKYLVSYFPAISKEALLLALVATSVGHYAFEAMWTSPRKDETLIRIMCNVVLVASAISLTWWMTQSPCEALLKLGAIELAILTAMDQVKPKQWESMLQWIPGISTKPQGPSSSSVKKPVPPEIANVELAQSDLEKIQKAVQKLEQELASTRDPNKSYAQSAMSLFFVLGMLLRAMPEKDVPAFMKKLGLEGMSEEQVHKGMNQLLKNLAGDEPKIVIGNAIAAKVGKVDASFESMIQSVYDGELLPADLGKINTWVSDKTDKLIPKLFDEFQSDNCALINTTLFDGKWQDPFAPAKQGKFTTLSGTAVDAQIMEKESDFVYFKGDDFAMLQIPYKTSGDAEKPFAYTIFLPDNPKAIGDLEKKLTPDFIQDCHAKAKMTNGIKLYLPKVDLKTDDRGLKASLESLGYPVPTILSRFNGDPLTEIGQMCCIKCDEKGTKAAAASYAMTNESACFPPPPKITFDARSPFIAQVTREGHSLFQLAIKNEEGLAQG
ncbi:serpin family protein [Simkania sp.]|uniref:serpin family protein n=1 Tax=Simkania sp. TaxID=34094 RepID=UPI003B51BBB6